MEIEISSYICDRCGGEHWTLLVQARDYKFRNYVDYPKLIGGRGYGAPTIELEWYECESTMAFEPLQVVGRKTLNISEAEELAKKHGVEIPDGFFDKVIANAVAKFFVQMKKGD